MNAIKPERLTIRRIVTDVQPRIAKWAVANSGTALNNTPSIALLRSLGFELIGSHEIQIILTQV